MVVLFKIGFNLYLKHKIIKHKTISQVQERKIDDHDKVVSFGSTIWRTYRHFYYLLSCESCKMTVLNKERSFLVRKKSEKTFFYNDRSHVVHLRIFLLYCITAIYTIFNFPETEVVVCVYKIVSPYPTHIRYSK
jgi:hypothetical protein